MKLLGSFNRFCRPTTNHALGRHTCSTGRSHSILIPLLLALLIDRVSGQVVPGATSRTTLMAETTVDGTIVMVPPTDESFKDEEFGLADSDPSDIDRYQRDLFAWIRKHGGFVHEGLEVRHVDGEYGVFATQALLQGEALWILPAACTLSPSYGGDHCQIARQLHREWQKKEQSFFQPYLEYLQATRRKTRLPVLFGEAGQALFQEMLHDESIPPYDVTWWEFLEHCDIQKEEESAFEIVRRHSVNGRLLPLYDTLRHSHDPIVYNIVLEDSQSPKKSFTIRAKRDISSGEELRQSLTKFPGSNNLHEWYGTSAILTDHGIVENLPQRFFFDETEHYMLAFELRQHTSAPKQLEVEWLRGLPGDEDIEYALNVVLALEDFAEKNLHERPNDIPVSEWSLILNYHTALLRALDAAIVASGFDQMHEEQYQLGYDQGYYTCAMSNVDPYFFDDYEVIEDVRSHYQQHRFKVNKKTKDACFTIMPYVQMCTCYRPTHHEVSVHYTARYVDKIERVLWIGGGDSMLLHDILKYPTLQKVVGLELDQFVTRYNFKHLGTQPHWDNDKVEWWYGDATKTLLMLPEEYYGSFDMILMDLSDTAMQLTVTDNLNIFQTIALLLKKGGVITKNENNFLEHFSRVFPNVIHAYYGDVPVICAQSFVLGSYDIDFWKKEPVDHGIMNETIFMKDRDDLQVDNRFDAWHDYRRNISNTNAGCLGESLSELPPKQEKSPGIIMVIEAEDVLLDLSDADTVKMPLVDALEKAGLRVIDSTGKESRVNDAPQVIAISMQEGYLIARLYPKHSYCAFDLHLWGSYEKQAVAKNNLVTAVGSDKKKESSSMFRIISGGLFGVETWKEDAKRRGPRNSHRCKDSEDATLRGGFNDNETSLVVLNEMLELSNCTDMSILLFCETIESCSSLESLRKSEKVADIVHIWSCVNDTSQALDYLACRKDVHEFLVKRGTKTKFGALVIDSSVNFSMGRIILSVFQDKYETHQPNVLALDALIIANSLNTTQNWRRTLLERIRRDVLRDDPLFRAEVFLNTTYSSMEIGVVKHGDWKFVSQVHKMVTKLETNFGFVDVRGIHGSNFSVQEDHGGYDPVHYPPDVFDLEDPSTQFLSQVPVGLQSVFQLQIEAPHETLSLWDKVEVFDAIGWEPAIVTAVYIDDSVEVQFDNSRGQTQHVDRMSVRKATQYEYQKIENSALSSEIVSIGDLVDVLYIEEANEATGFDGRYRGHISGINGDGTYNVESERDVPPAIGVHPGINPMFKLTAKADKKTALEMPKLSAKIVKAALENALHVTDSSQQEDIVISEFHHLGEGSLWHALWSFGNAAVLWDGRDGVNVNLYLNDENFDLAEQFLAEFKAKVPSMRVILRDTFPRGTGRVVNFQKDLQEDELPLWVTRKTSTTATEDGRPPV